MGMKLGSHQEDYAVTLLMSRKNFPVPILVQIGMPCIAIKNQGDCHRHHITVLHDKLHVAHRDDQQFRNRTIAE